MTRVSGGAAPGGTQCICMGNPPKHWSETWVIHINLPYTHNEDLYKFVCKCHE
jgi:hypothetical protein